LLLKTNLCSLTQKTAHHYEITIAHSNAPMSSFDLQVRL